MSECNCILSNFFLIFFHCTEPCPPNAEYIDCGPSCIPTCQEPSTNCTGSCISGCFCKPGYVFYGPRCVPIEKCGCLDDHNNYYEVINTFHRIIVLDLQESNSKNFKNLDPLFLCQPGEVILGDGCSKLCRCAGNYTFECVDYSCDSDEECRDNNGVPGCHPIGKSHSCQAMSSVHFICVCPFSAHLICFFL